MSPTARKALVIEDDADFAAYLAAVLRRDGIEPVVARTLEEARRALLSSRFDLVTLDLDLGGASGGELLLELRADPELARIPVIVVSGVPVEDPKVRALVEAFADRPSLALPDACVEKPAPPERLRRAVALATGRAAV